MTKYWRIELILQGRQSNKDVHMIEKDVDKLLAFVSNNITIEAKCRVKYDFELIGDQTND